VAYDQGGTFVNDVDVIGTCAFTRNNYSGSVWDLAGDITLYAGGTLILSRTGDAWRNYGMSGPVTLQGDAGIQGGMNDGGKVTYVNSPVSGAFALTMTATGTGTGITVGGSGNWDIAGLAKAGTGKLRMNAPEVCGQTLKVNAGVLELYSGKAQTVTELWLGGVQQLPAGTYGATGSGADFVDDTHFSGSGVVTLAAAVPCTSCPDYLAPVLDELCNMPNATSVPEYKLQVVNLIANTVEAPICDDGAPGAGSEANCEAYLEAEILNETACVLLKALFE
jgi:hypothetical protein